MIFEINNDAVPAGTSLRGYFAAAYKDLVAVFGPPLGESDGYKVSSEWKFVGPNGAVVTLYDYKETDLYDSDLPSVEEFRALPNYEWHIGAEERGTADEFCGFLGEKLAQFKNKNAVDMPGTKVAVRVKE